jgi:hypothetical protein
MPIRRSPNVARHTPPQPGRDRPEQVVAINRNHSGRNHPARTPNRQPQHSRIWREVESAPSSVSSPMAASLAGRFEVGGLAHLLRNRIYIGEVV